MPTPQQASVPLDFEAYHQGLAEGLGGESGRRAAASVQRHGSFGFQLPGGPVASYVPTQDGIEVRPGDANADTLIELDPADWRGVVQELETAPGLLYAGRGRCLRGKAIRWVMWEPALRALYNGRPVFDPDRFHLRGSSGGPLDPAQAFAPEAPDRELAHFLREAGYLFMRGVFGPAEVADLLAEARRLRQQAEPGDELSWWGKDRSGGAVVTRVTRAGAGARLGALPNDPRLLRLAALSDTPLVNRQSGSDECVSVIYKTPEMSEGLSDLPWHRDCGMGGHAAMCPVLIVSVFLTESTPESGELRMMPGSHRGSYPYVDARQASAPSGIGFAAQPGDVSAHFGDVMHAAPPPTDPRRTSYRISAVTGFAPEGARHHRGEKNYNRVLHQREDGQIEHLGAVARRR